MDFFEAQARAKNRTTRLVALFVLAVLATIVASYFAAVIGFTVSGQHARMAGSGDYGYGAQTPSFAVWQPRLFLGVAAAVLAVVSLASLAKWAQFSSGGPAVAESVGGRRVDLKTTDLAERRLLNVVEEMAIASGTSVPAVYVLDDEPAINAFAAGLTTGDAVVTVTRGALEKLSRDELQGVIGHEFSHILNGDMRLNLRLTALLFGILVLGLAGRGILWSLRGARFGSRDNKNSGGVLAAILVAGIALLIIGYAGYFFGRLIQAGVSRQREYLADASAVQFTRNPAGLAGALRKIGGYALGSSLQTSKAAAIGHFFFAQSFRSGITGLWSTHPPLAERIRAIDPHFDGTMIEPPQVVDVAHESFAQAGLAPASLPKPAPAVINAALAAVASAGTLGPESVAAAESLLASVPPALRDATRDPLAAVALIAGLLLDRDPVVRARQRAFVTAAGTEQWAQVERLEPSLAAVETAQKLPLLQLALPSLRRLAAAEQERCLKLVDDLIQADGTVSAFEFALRTVLGRSLKLGRNPAAGVIQLYSFNAVTSEIGTVLSALAHAASEDERAAADAFAAGATQIKLIASRLRYVSSAECEAAALGAALDKLATASGPIKQRTLIAAAHVVSADGEVRANEVELLRAVSAALDVPMPQVAPA